MEIDNIDEILAAQDAEKIKDEPVDVPSEDDDELIAEDDDDDDDDDVLDDDDEPDSELEDK